jgi:hypothetical protein
MRWVGNEITDAMLKIAGINTIDLYINGNLYGYVKTGHKEGVERYSKAYVCTRAAGTQWSTLQVGPRFDSVEDAKATLIAHAVAQRMEDT